MSLTWKENPLPSGPGHMKGYELLIVGKVTLGAGEGGGGGEGGVEQVIEEVGDGVRLPCPPWW